MGILIAVASIVVVGGAALVFIANVLDGGAPDEPVQAFFAAAQSNDCDEMWSQLSPKMRGSESAGGSTEGSDVELKGRICQFAAESAATLSLVDTRITEQSSDQATVEVRLRDGEGWRTLAYEVAKIGGDWKIDEIGFWSPRVPD